MSWLLGNLFFLLLDENRYLSSNDYYEELAEISYLFLELFGEKASYNLNDFALTTSSLSLESFDTETLSMFCGIICYFLTLYSFISAAVGFPKFLLNPIPSDVKPSNLNYSCYFLIRLAVTFFFTLPYLIYFSNFVDIRSPKMNL